MWIIKIGGSLLNSPHLIAWLKTINQYGAGRVVIVPGGGEFADQVREQQALWLFDDVLAHRMALRSMDQYGLLLSGMDCDVNSHLLPVSSKQEILESLDDSKIPVWLPSQMLDLDSDIPQNWDMTSDSLAAWLARKLDAERLMLIKAFTADLWQDTGHLLGTEELVDPLFRNFSQGSFRTHIFLADQSEYLTEMLNGHIQEQQGFIRRPAKIANSYIQTSINN